jgi:hypothetical protein
LLSLGLGLGLRPSLGLLVPRLLELDVDVGVRCRSPPVEDTHDCIVSKRGAAARAKPILRSIQRVGPTTQA